MIQKTDIIAIAIAIIIVTTTTRCIPCFNTESHHLIESALQQSCVWRLFGIGLARGKGTTRISFPYCSHVLVSGDMVSLQNNQQGLIELI